MAASGIGSRGLIPRLGPRAWTIIGGGAVVATSYGFVMAFLMLYLHYARGMSLAIAGIALAVTSVGGLITSPLVGWAADRFGPRIVLVAASGVAASGTALLVLVHTPWQAFAATLVFGLGGMAIAAPESTLLATAVPKERRSAAFAMQYMGMALGWSTGALLGGWTVDLARAETFVTAFLVAALPFVAYAGIIASLSNRSPYEEDEEESATAEESASVPEATRPGYRVVLRDRAYLHILAYFFLVITFAGVQLDATFPSYAVGVGGVSTRVVGLAFAADTIVIVASQLFVLRGLVGRRRTRALVVSSLFTSLSWLLCLVAGHAGGGVPAAAGFVAAMMAFAVAETTWSPCLSPMVNDIAPARLRGRYNALLGTVDSGGRIIGPVFAGFLLAAGLGDTLVVLLAVVTASGALLALRLERQVPKAANVVGEASASPV